MRPNGTGVRARPTLPRHRPTGRGLCFAAITRPPGSARSRFRQRMRLRPSDPSWLLTLLASGGALIVAVVLVATRLAVASEQAVIPTSDWPWTSDGVAVEPIAAGGPAPPGDAVVALT